MSRPFSSVIALLLAASLLSAAGPEEQAPRLIDDTPEYCRSLARRLAVLPAARMEPSRSLGVEGLRLCGDGHLRTGITKLRRALRAAQEAGANNATAAMPVVTRNAAR